MITLLQFSQLFFDPLAWRRLFAYVRSMRLNFTQQGQDVGKLPHGKLSDSHRK